MNFFALTSQPLQKCLLSYLMGVCWVLPPLSVLSLDLFVGVTSLSFVQPGRSQSINNNNHPFEMNIAEGGCLVPRAIL